MAIRRTSVLRPAERAQMLADQLSAQALVPRIPQQGGPVAVQYGLGEGLAQLGEALLARRAMKRADTLESEEREKARASNEALIRALMPEEGPLRMDASGNLIPGTAPEILDVDTGRPALVGRQEQLAALLEGADPLEAAGFLRSQLLGRMFAPPQQIDLGDSIGFVDARGNIVQRISKGATPDALLREQGETFRHATPSGSAALSAETARRGQDLDYSATLRGQDITLRGQDLNAQLERDKLGMQQSAEADAETRRRARTAMTLNNTLSAVQDALNLVGWRTAGAIGAATRNMPYLRGAGTDALSLAKTVDTIKANLSFEELQRMREESKTGGALGNITERELDLLGATVANLDPDQDPDQLRAQLQKVEQHLRNLAELKGLVEPQPSVPPEWADIPDLMQRYLPKDGS